VATLVAFPVMMQRARKREGLRVCRAAWLVGVNVCENREIVADERWPDFDIYERIRDALGRLRAR
jgi:hypothetical protein